MPLSDDEARLLLRDAIRSVEEDYRTRGIFRDRFGLSHVPALVVVDFAYGWTDDAYAGGSRRLDGPVEATRAGCSTRRGRGEYRSSTRPAPGGRRAGTSRSSPRPNYSPSFRTWDECPCRIDERVCRIPGTWSSRRRTPAQFFGTHLAPYLIGHGVDTLLITGCSTSALYLCDGDRREELPLPADRRSSASGTARRSPTSGPSSTSRPGSPTSCRSLRPCPTCPAWPMPDGGGSLTEPSARVRVSRRRSTRRGRGRAARRRRPSVRRRGSPSGPRSS